MILPLHQVRHYVIALMGLASLIPLAGCDTLFGTKGVSHYPARTASIEARRDEDIFITIHEILFETGHQDIDEEGLQTISYVADMIRKSNPALITVTGYSDSFGDAAYNKNLSLKRAQTVVRKLKAHGIDTRVIKVAGMGEENPAIPTQDGVKLLDNRRVVIALKK